MPQVINTNIASLNAQRNLNTSQSSLNTSLQRLSTGLRINSAKDDAAGLAIADRMTSQIRGLNQASRNANDGISMAQTAEGALSSAGDILQRIRELAVQSSNASNSSSDRQALQKEVSALTSELDRIATSTQFNGQNLLDGTLGTSKFQVGANANQLISITSANFRTNSYGNNRTAGDGPAAKADATVAAAAAAAQTGGSVTVNGYLGSSTAITVAAGASAKDTAALINAQTSKTGVTATASTEANATLVSGAAYSLAITADNATAVNVSFTIGAGTAASDYASAISAFNAVSSQTGVTAEYDSVNGGLKLSNASGSTIGIQNKSTATAADVSLASYTAAGGLGTAASVTDAGTAATAFGAVVGSIKLDSQQSFSVTDTTTAATDFGIVGSSTLKTVASLDVTTFDNAQAALAIVDSALAAVSSQRASYGAVQNRFENTVANLMTSSENLSASRSRIQDTDFAAETANLTRAQILQQAGTAMLAQAKALPQNVLSLLQG